MRLLTKTHHNGKKTIHRVCVSISALAVLANMILFVAAIGGCDAGTLTIGKALLYMAVAVCGMTSGGLAFRLFYLLQDEDEKESKDE